MYFNERIRALREDKDISQEGMGKALNLSQIAISQYERGTREPNFDTLNKYADFFKTSVDYILGRTDETKPYPRTKLYLTAARSKDNKPKEWREIDVEKIRNAPETDEDL